MMIFKRLILWGECLGFNIHSVLIWDVWGMISFQSFSRSWLLKSKRLSLLIMFLVLLPFRLFVGHSFPQTAWVSITIRSEHSAQHAEILSLLHHKSHLIYCVGNACWRDNCDIWMWFQAKPLSVSVFFWPSFDLNVLITMSKSERSL